MDKRDEGGLENLEKAVIEILAIFISMPEVGEWRYRKLAKITRKFNVLKLKRKTDGK